MTDTVVPKLRVPALVCEHPACERPARWELGARGSGKKFCDEHFFPAYQSVFGLTTLIQVEPVREGSCDTERTGQ